MAVQDFENKVLQALDFLQKGQDELLQRVGGLEILHEETEEKIDQIIEAVSPEMQKLNVTTERVEKLEESDELQNTRLSALEQNL